MAGVEVAVEPRVLHLTIEKPAKLFGRRSKAAKESATSFSIRNPTDDPVMFKVRTNQPTRYNVTPASGVIEADGSATVTIAVVETELEGIILNHKELTDPLAPPDRFLVQSLTLSDEQRRALLQSDERQDMVEQFWTSLTPAELPRGVKLRVTMNFPNDVLIAAGINKKTNDDEDDDDDDDEMEDGEIWLRNQEAELDRHAQGLKERLAIETEDNEQGALPLPMNPEEFQAELLRLSEKYNALVAHSLELTSERNQLRQEADTLMKPKPQEEKDKADADGEEKEDSASRGPQGFSLPQIIVVVLLCVFTGSLFPAGEPDVLEP